MHSYSIYRVVNYRPPPAQAQAQLAQAQAHPPPLRPLLLPLDLGTGLVLLVTALVKLVRLPIAPAEKVLTPLTTEAAKSEPGICGSED